MNRRQKDKMQQQLQMHELTKENLDQTTKENLDHAKENQDHIIQSQTQNTFPHYHHTNNH